MKIINWIKYRLPISRKRHMQDLDLIRTILDAIIQSERQHSQIEMNLVKNVDMLTLANQNKATKNTKVQDEDVAFR